MKVLFTTIFVLFLGSLMLAQDANKNWFQIYGFAMTDAGYNANQINPQWYDVLRPSRLPTYKNQYCTDGNTYISARQTRFGVNWYMLDNQAVRLNREVIYLNNSPVGALSLPYSVGAKGPVFHLNLELRM
jgi:hypothetical protein